jgi:hypothetical protein
MRILVPPNIAGSLQISHFVHGCTFLLVVNGIVKGHIWFDCRADYSGLVSEFVRWAKYIIYSMVYNLS